MSLRRQAKRILVGIGGGIVLVAGIIMIPYPGPGWLIVFAGLGILSTEFEWAHRLLGFAKSKYDAWQKWLEHQNPSMQIAVGLVTTIVVILTLWLINGYGIIDNALNLGIDWIHSPFFR